MGSSLKHVFLLLVSFLLSLIILSPSSARIYESPSSSEITGIPGADNEPPVTTINISLPQYKIGDNLYISGSTPISFTAIDYGIVPSGVNYTEYKIDNETWTRYTNPFTLSSYIDGQHTITYRSIDNASNTETEKTVTVTLDKTPPSTTITASDMLAEGVINIVSPRTIFFLNSTDNLTGIKETQYRIDHGSWSTYIAGFPLPSLAGTHTIGYRAIDNLGNEEIEKTLTARLIFINITKESAFNPIVLAGAWGSTPSTQKAIDNLTAMLSASGITYYIPKTEDEFKESLRAGRYNIYLLIDFAKEELIDELKEAVNYGDGIVYIKTAPDDEHSVSDIFGVRFNGMSTNKDMPVNLIESVISKTSTLKSKGKSVKTFIESATAKSLGYVNDKKETYPVIISNQYGRGKAILFSFDLLNSEDKAKVQALIINSINNVSPVGRFIRALADEPISINIQNSTEPVDIKVTETIPETTGADTIKPDAAISGSTITWQFSLSANENKKPGYYLILPDRAGDYQTNTEVRYNSNGYYRLYGNYTLTLNVWKNSTELLNSIISDLNNLIPTDKNDSDMIERAIAKLSSIEQNASNKKQAEKNIESITEAIKELNKASTDISAIRIKLDELLKIWQKKWTLMPEGKEEE